LSRLCFLRAGVLGAYFFHNSVRECLDKNPACSLTSAAALTIFSSCLTSVLMLGWKLGTAYRTYTRIKALEAYGALYRQVASAHGDHEAQRLKDLAGSSAAAVAPMPLGTHAAAVVMASVGSPAAAAEAVPAPPAHPHQHVGAADYPPQLLAHPIVPGMPASQLANIAHVGGSSSQAVEVRGMCDGCGQNVMSDDEGRVREGTKYFHLGCIKGHCGHCGRIVHADADRVNVRGVYFHRDCQ
jgi:hypothetical protein